ncbi:TIGR02270 family protein [Crenothrix polyspora]|uniref:TIGR02270 family protein n=1 Tax=Crenothrix polyspora TaxID=360316 RepID=A0A1R4HA52_9GAMM|nr:TIGR02270 family protein [Crenothrix polyspora]SJM93093.1 conserved hypothetical protein [Crenothrix polyspora]
MNNIHPVIPHIIDQHAEEAAFLWLLRNRAIHAPHYSLKDLAKLDNRVEAHIDGLRIAGDYGWDVSIANLEAAKEAGEAFVAGILALEGNRIERINAVYQIVETTPALVNGLVSAFGWVAPPLLQGKVNGLLVSQSPLWRRVGIAVCAIHRVNPGKFLEQAIIDEDVGLRTRALRAAGELARVDLKPIILDQVNEPNPTISFWAAWVAVLLGDRGRALQSLQNHVLQASEFTIKALHIVCRVLEPHQVRELLKVLVTSDSRLREAIIGIGVSGDPLYMPWLIKQMATPELAKIAGEAFSFISGVDIAYDGLEGEMPADFTAGPTEDTGDENVAMAPDEDLPCPNPPLMERWWQQNQQQFKANNRYLWGKSIDMAQCQTVLKTGKQRQRQAAALELALMQATAPLFETRAIGKNQQRLL